jgi:hypothetical protein
MASQGAARRDKNPEPETVDTEFSSSRRAAEAWAETPDSWRKVQAEQLDEALTALREDEDSKGETPADERRARWSLMRRFQH